jgi:hypothetical protein
MPSACFQIAKATSLQRGPRASASARACAASSARPSFSSAFAFAAHVAAIR